VNIHISSQRTDPFLSFGEWKKVPLRQTMAFYTLLSEA
jgi:hypothetical protein